MKTEKMVKVTYRGVECEITEQQYKDLQEGWLTFKDLFD